MKTCSICGESKPHSEYHNNKSKPDGKDHRCKACIKERDRLRYQRKREEILAHKANYRRANRDEIRQRQRIYYHDNKDKVLAVKARRLKDPSLQITDTYRKHLNKFIRRKGIGKASQLIGCEWDTFKPYMEAQFKQGMSWDNYGQWEIDHIIPCSAFDQTDPNHRAVCWHYINLMPLWKDENRNKFDSLPDGMDIDEYVEDCTWILM